MALGATGFLIQKAEMRGTMHADVCKLSHLAMMWTVRHRWTAGARSAFNYYKDWTQLLIRQTGDPSVMLLIQEGVTQGGPISVVLYGINLVYLEEDIWEAYMGILTPFYADDVVFNGSEKRSCELINLLM